MFLLGVPTLSTFCSTPPPSRTPSPQTLTGIRSNSSALRQENGKFGPLATQHPTTSLQKSFVKNQIACLVRIVLCERRLGRNKPDQCRLFSSAFFCPLLFLWRLFWKFYFYSIFSFLLSIFSLKKHSLLFEQIGEHNISFLLPRKTFSLCSLLLRSLLWIRNLLFVFSKTKQTSVLHLTTKNSFHVPCCIFVSKERICVYLLKNSCLLLFSLFFSHLLLTVVRSVVAVTQTSAPGHPLHQAVSFHFFAISFHFFQGFLFLYFLMIMCFSLFLFDVLLYSFFYLVFSSFGHLFVFPTFLSHSFWQKFFFLFYLFFFDLLSFFLFFCQLFFFFQLFTFHPFLNLFFNQKTCHSFYVLLLLYSLVFFFLPTRLFSFFPLFTVFSVHFLVF